MLNVIKFYNKIYFTNTLFKNEYKTKNFDDNFIPNTMKYQFLPFIHFNFLLHFGDSQKKFVQRADRLES